MDPQTLGTLIKQAADIAGTVPESLRDAAFQRALDALLGQSTGTSIEAPSGRSTTADERKGVVPARKDRSAQSATVTKLLEVMDRTELAPILRGRKVLDRALLVLRSAETHSIDALTPVDIAEVLAKKFREPTTPSAVRMALDRSPAYTDRRPSGGSFVYTLMAPGEAYLDSLSEPSAAPAAGKSRNKKPQPRKTSTPASSQPGPSVDAPKRKKGARPKRAAKSGRPGPKAALESLKAEGFFAKPRVMAEILAFLKEEKTYVYQTSDMTATLQRLVRQGTLTRARNAESQFQYIAK